MRNKTKDYHMKVRNSIVYPVALLLCCAAGAQAEASFPSQITTSDGTTYQQVAKVRVDPDGILVNYEPTTGGIGLAKLKFRNLPEDLQKQYGYDPKAAADYEKAEAQATEQWRSQEAASDAIARYRTLAELHQALAGNDMGSYTVSLDSNGKVSAQGVTSTPPPVSVPESGPPAPVSFAYPNPLVYLPLGTSREEPPPRVVKEPLLLRKPSLPAPAPMTSRPQGTR